MFVDLQREGQHNNLWLQTDSLAATAFEWWAGQGGFQEHRHLTAGH